MNDTSGFTLTLGTYRYRLLIEPLLSLKEMLTKATLILIDGHCFTSHRIYLYFNNNSFNKANKGYNYRPDFSRLIAKTGVKF